MSETARCYRDRDNGVYFTREAHHVACTDADCRGCRPCPEDHCQAAKNCTWHTAEGELTCGRCVGGARRDLRWIEALSSLLMTAAMSDGIESEAANLAGPSVDPEAWSWRKAAARQGKGWHVSLVEEDDEHHPARVLGTWERMIREDYGHDTTSPLTVASAAGYLDRQLHRIAQDDEQDFPQLRRELRKCRQHLEAVLHNDDRPDRGAPCPDCTSEETGVGPRLVRVWGYGTTDRYDEWRCPRKPDDHKWSQSAYVAYVEERRKATA